MDYELDYSDWCRRNLGSRCPGGNSWNIEKHMLNFEVKAWWKLAWHKLCTTTGNNVLNPVCVVLIAGLIVGYEFDVGVFLARDI